MSYPAPNEKVRPSAGWYAVPIGIWAVSIVIFVIALVSIFRFFDTGIDRVANHAQLSVPADGLTVYTTNPDAIGTCTLTEASGGGHALSDVNVDLEIGLEGPTYHALASTPDDLGAGSYRLDCADIGRLAKLGVGERIDFGTAVKLGVFGVVLPVALGLVGLIVLIVLMVKRHNSKSRIRNAQAASRYGAWPSQPAGPPQPPCDRNPSPPPPPPPPANG